MVTIVGGRTAEKGVIDDERINRTRRGLDKELELPGDGSDLGLPCTAPEE